MSNQLSSRYPLTLHPRKRVYTTDSYKNPPQIHYSLYEPHIAPSSSPLRSSSPPMTPYSTRHARSDALIRSSPEIASDPIFHSVREHIEDSSFAWGPRYSSNRYPERAYTPSKHDRFSTHSYPPSSDFDVSEYSEDVDHDIPEVDSGHTSDNAPGRNSVFFSDGEEEEENHEFSFGHDGYRTTFFRTSAERGQWRSHPIPLKSTPLPQAPRSASIPSRLPTPVVVDSTRTNSEPAPSIVTGLGFSSVKPDQYDNLRGVGGPLPVSFKDVAENQLQPEVESLHALPSLTSDWESILDIDADGHEYERPSSPLPPSSPMSYSISILSRSVSPASSPVMRSSSPLSEISSLDQEERHADEVEDVETGYPDIGTEIRSSASSPTFALDADIKPGNAIGDEHFTTTSTAPSRISDSASFSVGATVIPDFQIIEPFNPPSSSSAIINQNPHPETKLLSITGDETDIASEATDIVPPPVDSLVVNRPIDPMENQSHPLGFTRPQGCKPSQEILLHLSTSQLKAEGDDNIKHVMRRKRKKGNDDDEHPILKKRKTDARASRVADLPRPATHNLVRNEKTGSGAREEDKNLDQQVSAMPKKRRKGEVSVSVSCPASSTKRSKPYRPQPSSLSHIASVDGNGNDSHQPAPLPTETAVLNAEICGMLIETMALSRASSLPLSSLYKMMMQTQPALRSQRSEQEWLTLFAQVLHDGEAGKGSGVFGKVESSGKDDSNRPLEAQWFYVPEQDDDQERAALIRSMMPRPAKRTETKKYKQYYWRPLDKISKWDPEDEL